MLREFTRFANKFVVCMNVMYFLRKSREGEVYVPVFSLEGAVGMALLVHNRYGHMGRIKLWECMREQVFTPWLQKIVNDVATICESSQKGKTQRIYVKPPILKLDAQEPFDLVVIDCVSLPVTVNGYGCDG